MAVVELMDYIMDEGFVFCFYFSCIGLAREYALGSVFLSLFRVWIDRALIMKQGNQGLEYL